MDFIMGFRADFQQNGHDRSADLIAADKNDAVKYISEKFSGSVHLGYLQHTSIHIRMTIQCSIGTHIM